MVCGAHRAQQVRTEVSIVMGPLGTFYLVCMAVLVATVAFILMILIGTV